MLNRNDRKSLKRNRAAVSWLSLIIAILLAVIVNMYNNSESSHTQIENDLSEMKQYHNEIILKNKKIDSLQRIVKIYTEKKDSVTVQPIKQYKPKTTKVDTLGFSKAKNDSSNKIILKDSIK